MALFLSALLVNVSPLFWWARSTFYMRPALWVLVQHSGKNSNVYNVLWVLVFGFATLNILGLVARSFETGRSRLNFGEILAIMVVVVSIFLLASEMLHVFKIFPIKLGPR